MRNYQARNFMRDQMRVGDQVFFYHSSCEQPGIAGIAEVSKLAYPDATQFDPGSKYFDPKATPQNPRWFNVDVRLVKKTRLVGIKELRGLSRTGEHAHPAKGQPFIHHTGRSGGVELHHGNFVMTRLSRISPTREFSRPPRRCTITAKLDVEWWPLIYCWAGRGFLCRTAGYRWRINPGAGAHLHFRAQHFPPDRILHLALGTTMAAIIFSSAASCAPITLMARSNWQVVKYITPGIIIGTLGGATLASRLSSQVLSIIFVVFIYYAATQMLLRITPKPSRKLPGRAGMLGAGGIIGVISSFVAIGGGLLTVPFLSFCNVRLQHAIGTAAAVGFPIALAGAIGYIINGMAQSQPLPEYSLGYVYLPALAGWCWRVC